MGWQKPKKSQVPRLLFTHIDENFVLGDLQKQRFSRALAAPPLVDDVKDHCCYILVSILH
jgi:hypothetical protein